MNIITGQNQESFGFVNSGWFSDRLYIFEKKRKNSTGQTQIKYARELDGVGIASYGNFIGFIMSCLSLATSVRIGEKALYIDNESFCHYVLRKTACPIDNKFHMNRMHQLYVENKNGVETAAYDDATVKKVNTCFLNRINNSDVPLELWSIIQTCLESIPKPDVDIENRKELDDEIDTFTKEFLRPYIKNEVDPDSLEEITRRPMVETLIEKLEKKFPHANRAECQNKALNVYIRVATHGLFQNFHLDYEGNSMDRLKKFDLYLEDLPEDMQISVTKDKEYQELSQWYIEWAQNTPRPLSKEFLILLNALIPALKKDFPDSNLSSSELIEKTTEALNVLANEYKNDPVIEKKGKDRQIFEINLYRLANKQKNHQDDYIKNYLGEREYENYIEDQKK